MTSDLWAFICYKKDTPYFRNWWKRRNEINIRNKQWNLFKSVQLLKLMTSHTHIFRRWCTAKYLCEHQRNEISVAIDFQHDPQYEIRLLCLFFDSINFAELSNLKVLISKFPSIDDRYFLTQILTRIWTWTWTWI